MIQTAIVSNRVVTPAGIQKKAVIINNGKIHDLRDESPAGDFPVIDIGDKVLMPGIIDPHVHINEPGRTEWEGFDTATKAGAAGGITTLVDMPLNCSPVTTTTKAFDEKIKAVLRPNHALHCNCGFWAGVIPGNENEIESLIAKGVLGFKAFLTHSGIDEFPNVNEQDLRKAMPIIAKYNLPLLVHCEISSPTPHSPHATPHSPLATRLSSPTRHSQLATRLPSPTRHSPLATRLPSPTRHSPLATRHYSDYLNSRPDQWEHNAIALMIRLCKEFNCRTHIVHLSSAGSIEQIARAKQEGLPLTVETAQHYLYFDAEAIGDGQTVFKCAPPIREKENNKLLWQALKDGIIDFVATDHSPAPPAMKELETGDFMKAWGGIASLQLALPALWTAAKMNNCSINDIAKWLCERPAALPDLGKTKGKIEKGYDADLLIWDPDKQFTVTKEILYHRHKLTPYLGEKLYGVVEQTWLGGEKIFDKGDLVLNKGGILLRSH